jgi:hypothetical protein
MEGIGPRIVSERRRVCELNPRKDVPFVRRGKPGPSLGTRDGYTLNFTRRYRRPLFRMRAEGLPGGSTIMGMDGRDDLPH